MLPLLLGLVAGGLGGLSSRRGEVEMRGRSIAAIFPPEDRQRGLPEKEMRIAEVEGRAEEEGFGHGQSPGPGGGLRAAQL